VADVVAAQGRDKSIVTPTCRSGDGRRFLFLTESRSAGAPLWELRKDHVTWSCELRFDGGSWGWEARILRDGELHMADRWLLKEQGIASAETERRDRERGSID
jgi:hypothetical protein